MINRILEFFFFLSFNYSLLYSYKRDTIQHSRFMHWFCLAPNLEQQRLQQNYDIMVNILNQSDEFK